MARQSRRDDSGRTVLVVDDQEETLASTRHLLEREGHRVLVAGSAAEAVEILRAHDVQVAIVDYFMPRMTGADLVLRIRSSDPFIQIILQTGYSGERPPRAMLAELDIQGYHDKTEDPERLLQWVEVALKTEHLIRGLRQREEVQQELVANCSHEFRTPLNIIAGYADLLRSGDLGDLPASAVSAAEGIHVAAGGLAHLVTDFLSYAKVNAGVQGVAHEPLRTRELITELERIGRLLVEDKDIAFTIAAAAAPEEFLGDGVKIRTVLRNLLSNAAKFTRQGQITLRVARDGDALRFEVRDTGCGIRPEDLDAVFEPFRQLDGSMSRAHGGVGLGLALSRKLARLLGGTLTVTSEVGVGSTFTLTLPARAGNEAGSPDARSGSPRCPAAAAG